MIDFTSVYQSLSNFVNSASFYTDLELIFGNNFNQTIAQQIKNQWLNQDFSDLPTLKIISSDILGYANGGYASSNNTISESINNITVTGTGTTGIDFNSGVVLESSGFIESTGTATITVTGNGASDSTGFGNIGISINGSGSEIRSVDGAIELTGTGGNGTSSNYGIGLFNGGKILSTGEATITIVGKASSMSSGQDNTGVRIQDGSKITSVDNAIELNGTGGNGTNYNVGIDILGGGVISSSIGAIKVTGTAGDASNALNYGVWLRQGSLISSTGNTGIITITGQGSTTATANENHGIRIEDSNSKVSSVGASIELTGTAGNGASANFGVLLYNNAVVTSETGNITIEGTGGGKNDGNYGVVILDNSLISSTGTEANTATISIIGQGSTIATGNENDGIRIQGSSKITSKDASIDLIGKAGILHYLERVQIVMECI